MGIVSFSPKQDGTGDPSPTNVRPIHPGLVLKSKNLFNVNVSESLPSDTSSSNKAKRIFTPNTLIVGTSGTNYFAPNSASYSINGDIITINTKSGYGIGYAFKLIQGETYTMSYQLGSKDSVTVGVSSYTQDGTFTQVTSAAGNREHFIVPNDSDVILLTIKSGSGSYEKNIDVYNIQLELGSTPTEYEPYYDMEIYEGNVDFSIGELTVTYKMVTLTGDWPSQTWSWQCYTCIDNDLYDNNSGYNVRACSHTNNRGYGSEPVYDMDKLNLVSVSSGHQIRYRDNSNFTDLDTAKTYLQGQYNNGTPVQIVAKLATPTTYSLTASQLTQAYNQLVPVSPVMLARRRRMIAGCNPELPPQYKKVDYLESSGSQYILTSLTQIYGYKIQNTDTWWFW